MQAQSTIGLAVACWVLLATVAHAQGPASPPLAEVSEAKLGWWPKGVMEAPTSEDGLHVAFAVTTGKSARVHHDADVAEGFVSIVDESFSLSRDGLHLAYWAKLKKGYRLIADHAVVTDSDRPGPGKPAWSRDGTRFGYQLRRGKKVVAVVDSKPGPEWDEIVGPSFSDDGEHVVYVARLGKQVRVVLDGVEGRAFDTVTEVSFSSRGGRLAYLARDGKLVACVIDGVMDSTMTDFGEVGLTWSGDGRHIAYSVATGPDTWELRMDGRPGPRYQAIGKPVFSSDGEHLAFWGALKDPERGPRHVIRDGQAIGEVRLMAALALSHDGQRIAYMEALDELPSRFVVVVDGQRSSECSGLHRAPTFSPDGTHVAYIAQRAGRAQLVLDDQVLASHEAILWSRLEPFFGPGGEHRTYLAYDERRFRVFHNGAQGPAYDAVLQPGPSVRSDGSVEYLAVRGDALYRVRQPAGSR